MHRGLRKRWIFCETPVSIKSKDIMRIDSNSSGSTACLYNAQVYKRSSGKAYARWHHFLQAHPLASSFLYLTCCCCCCCCWDALWRTGPVQRRKPVLTIYFVIPSFASFRRITKRLPNCPYSPIFSVPILKPSRCSSFPILLFQRARTWFVVHHLFRSSWRETPSTRAVTWMWYGRIKPPGVQRWSSVFHTE